MADQADAQLQEAAFKKLYSEEYYDRFLQDDVRPDGRGLSVCRPVSIARRAVSSADGSAIVKVGASTVLAGVRLEVMVPSPDTPSQGVLCVSVEVTSLATPEYRPGKQFGVTSLIQQRLQDLLLGCGVVKLTDLCIAAGQAVWVLYLDVYILNAAGSLLDASLLAAVAALQDTALPAVHLTAEGNVERDAAAAAAGSSGGSNADGQQQQQQQQQQGGVSLCLGCQPLSLTCGLYRGRLVADPDHEEEGLMGATVSVVVDEQQRLLGVYSVGQANQKQILSCAELANRRHTELLEQLQQQQQGQGDMES